MSRLSAWWRKRFAPLRTHTVRLRHARICTARTLASRYFELLPERPLQEPRIRFVGAAPPAAANIVTNPIAPAQYYAELHRCLAFPRANFLVKGSRVMYDLYARAEAFDTFGISDFVTSTAIPKPSFQLEPRCRANVFAPLGPETYLASGLQMFGFLSWHYGHFLLEYLPRMLVFDGPYCPDDMPIVIDSGLPKSCLEALQLLNSKKRRIIELPTGGSVKFRRLGFTRSPALSPQDMHPSGLIFDTIYPSDILSAMRDKIFAAVNKQAAIGPQTRKIFLSRAGFQKRRLINEAAIASYLSEAGFEVVKPELLSFADQVRLFAESRTVVGSCSSALHNAMFCSPGAVVVALCHSHPFNYRCHTSINSGGGAEVRFLLGQNRGPESFHGDYEIDRDPLEQAIQHAGSAADARP